VPDDLRDEVRRLAAEFGFFHWEVEFPQVFGRESGGFDVVLGNPPWERVKLQEKEFFVGQPEIIRARNAAQRKRLIAALAQDDPTLHSEWLAALRRSEGESHLVRSTGRYPLCGRGDVNTYSVFAELMRSLVSGRGRVGCITPSGIATDYTTAAFFSDLVTRGSLVSLFDFRNHDGLFYDVGHRRFKFCLMTLIGALGTITEPDFEFFAEQTADVLDPHRRFTLTPSDFALLNPNTQTCPVFRSRHDAELTMGIYRRVPVLVDEARGDDGNPWGVSFLRMFDMANDSHLFRARDELEAEGFRLDRNHFVDGDKRYLPLLEAKMVHQFNHRFGDYQMRPEGSEDTQLPDVPIEKLSTPYYAPLPRYWVLDSEVQRVVGDRWPHDWFIGWRDICRNTDERTMIASLVPRVAVAGTFYLLFPTVASPSASAHLLGVLDSFVFDYVSRQKAAGTHLNLGIIRQLPVLPPREFAKRAPWSGHPVGAWVESRVLELLHASYETATFALDVGYDGAPFRWNPERRGFLRAELDAAFFHLYGLVDEDVDYVMETFPIVKRHDEAEYGNYRTKALILDVYRKMADAIATGVPYETILDPPPADLRVAHQGAGLAAGTARRR
jgi:hypothetical protein